MAKPSNIGIFQSYYPCKVPKKRIQCRRGRRRIITNLVVSIYTKMLHLFDTKRKEINLWILSFGLLIITYFPTLRMPIQGDDFFALLNTNPDEPVSIIAESAHGFRFALESFLNGQTSHFYPTGFFFDVGLKRIMIDAYSFGSSASAVQSSVYISLGIGTFLSVCFFLSGVFSLMKNSKKPVWFATPVAIGLFASLQLSTKWSTYDPLVVHPIFGAATTFVGFFYLAIISRDLSRHIKPWKIALNSIIGIVGVSIYEGFYPFLFAAITINLYGILITKRSNDYNIQWKQSIAVVLPVALVFITRIYSRVKSTSEYQGTDIGISSKTFVSTITSFRSTSPGGMWNRAWNEVQLNGFYVESTIYFLVIIANALISVSYFYLNKSKLVEKKKQNDKTKLLIPAGLILALLIFGDFLFSLSKQWSDYLMIPGLTYMNALTSYWGWSIMIGILILFALQKVKNKKYFLSLIIILTSWGNVQFVLNSHAAQSEILNPSPFGSDLIRILESEPKLNMEDRCNLLTPFASNGSLGPNWRENVNRMYQIRFDTTFCDFKP